MGMLIMKYCAIICSLMAIASCKTLNIFQTDQHCDPKELIFSEDSSIVFSPGEKITLSVWRHDDLSVGSVFNIYNANASFGKWVMVDKDSCIALPAIGRIKVSHFSIRNLEDTIVSILSKEIVDPVIVIKVLNREVTVLGEVKSPGNLTLEKERVSVVEVIGMAEGFISYADVKHVQLLRDGKSYLIDMSVVNTPFANEIFVRPGDIVSVPSLKGKRLDQKAPTIIPFSSALTSVAVLLSLILR